MASRSREPRSGSQKSRSNVSQYKRPIPINLGIMVFVIIFLYLLVCIYAHFTSSHISPYEVQRGSLASDNEYRGLILRDEEIVYADQSGYINYYISAGEIVSGMSNVYTLDQTGNSYETITDTVLAGSILDSDALSNIKTTIESYRSDITDQSFDSVYDFKVRIQNNVLSQVNDRMLSEASSLTDDNSDTFSFIKAPKPGYIEYYIDGFESITKETFTADMMNEETYESRDLMTSDIVSAGDPVYKLITDDSWEIIIPITEEKMQSLSDTTSVNIRFKQNDLEAKASIETISRDGQYFAVLTLSKYMINFADQRYINIELEEDAVEGLKIPTSAITEKMFYTIPLEYGTEGGDNDEIGFLRETYNEDGSTGSEFISTTIYQTTDEVYYVDTADFNIGDYIIKADSNDRYQIGATASLKGVYNINRGYAVFRLINILYESDEYCIVEEGTKYGLSIYDHIVLDSSSVQEEEIINN